jgi:hypothetical protein
LGSIYSITVCIISVLIIAAIVGTVLGLIPLYIARGKKSDEIQSNPINNSSTSQTTTLPPEVNRTEIEKTASLKSVVTLETNQSARDYTLLGFDLTIITTKVKNQRYKAS